MDKLKNIVRFNRSRKTITLRQYDSNGRLVNKYRSYPLNPYHEEFTDNDIHSMLRNGDFYVVR